MVSTRASVHFYRWADDKPSAMVYRHSDGYPDGLGSDLLRFFEDVERQTRDTRFSDASYLAAKFVVWQARQYARRFDTKRGEFVPHGDARPLDFLGVGVLTSDPGDIEYRYHVRCGPWRGGESPRRPDVEVEEVPFADDETGRRAPLSDVFGGAWKDEDDA